VHGIRLCRGRPTEEATAGRLSHRPWCSRIAVCLSVCLPVCLSGSSRMLRHHQQVEQGHRTTIATATTCSVKHECKILIQNQFVLKLHWILSSDSDFHRTLKIRIEYRESRVLNSDRPRSSGTLNQAST
jgi:hypothetical protein